MKQERKWKLAFPHVMVLLVLLVLVSCLLTYIVPAGQYQYDENGYVIADSFQYVENTPVSPWDAVLKLTSSIAAMGTTYALLFVLGGMVSVMISSGSVENIVDFSIFKLQDKSLKVLIPCISVMMSLLGGLAGNDALITFVACGMLLARRTRLDRIAGMAIFYLPYITAQAIGPTVLMILMCQEMAGIPAVSGLSVRVAIWIIFPQHRRGDPLHAGGGDGGHQSAREAEGGLCPGHRHDDPALRNLRHGLLRLWLGL